LSLYILYTIICRLYSIFVLSIFCHTKYRISFILFSNHTMCVYVYVHFCDCVWSCWAEANLCKFFYYYRLLISVLPLETQISRGVGIPLTGITPWHYCACSNPELLMLFFVIFYVFNDLRSEVIVCLSFMCSMI
jgi:hypothetical protein